MLPTEKIRDLRAYIQAMNKYERHLNIGGITSLLKTLSVEERSENYEACAEIKRVIDNHNEKATDKLPTRLRKEEIYQLK